MKMLLFSDLHADRRRAERLVEQARAVDVVVGAGDLGNLRRQIAETVRWLAPIDRPTILVPGNSESYEELNEACHAHWPSATVLHGTGLEIEGIPVFGLGGGVPVTPFGSWSYDFTEGEARHLLADCPERAVLVSHSPPQGILDRSSGGTSLGSVAVRETMETKSPRLLVCGHIHASAGRQERVGETLVVNAGPDGVIVEPA